MIGVFDSGVGGFNSVPYLRRGLPQADIVYLADRKNAPYGIKCEDELVYLVERCIGRLASFGAQKILIACCTASTVWDKIADAERRISLPIIDYTKQSLSGEERSVLVIATERTVKSGAFGRVVRQKCPFAHIYEAPMQGLVSAVEAGAKEGDMVKATAGEIEKIKTLADRYNADSLILGCTHFSSVAELIGAALPRIKIINPARLGAEAFVREVTEIGIDIRERGRLIYI